MGDVDELHGVDRPVTGHGRVSPRPRHRSRIRTASAAGLVFALTLGTGTLGVLPARSAVVTSVADSTALQTSPIIDAAQVYAPSLPMPGDPGVATVTGPSITLPSLGPQLPSLGPQLPTPGLQLPTFGPSAPTEERSAPFTTDLPDQRAQVAIRTAMAQIGLPYVWGGDGPTNGDAGFDCSGLTTFAYAAAGVNLPRTAHTQYYTGPHVPPGAALQPGDHIFYGTPARVHHVGMYLGEGKMVNAPTFGKPVQVAYYRWGGDDDYLGATRPAATGNSTGLLPYAPPAPAAPTQPRDFPAPVAPAPTAEPQATVPQPVEAVTAAQAKAAAGVPTTTAAVPATSTVAPTTAPGPTSSSA